MAAYFIKAMQNSMKIFRVAHRTAKDQAHRQISRADTEQLQKIQKVLHHAHTRRNKALPKFAKDLTKSYDKLSHYLQVFSHLKELTRLQLMTGECIRNGTSYKPYYYTAPWCLPANSSASKRDAVPTTMHGRFQQRP